jgi:hypothetical protein
MQSMAALSLLMHIKWILVVHSGATVTFLLPHAVVSMTAIIIKKAEKRLIDSSFQISVSKILL